MLEILTFPFFQRAFIVGIILGALMAILGVLVVLRKMSFFSDAIGHSALAGIAIALLVNVNPFWGALAFALLVAFGISGVRSISKLSLDTLLGVFFSASVSLAVILVTFTPGYQADLISFLFGNILTVTSSDIATSIVIAAVVLGVFLWAGKAFVAISLDPALAKAEGIPVKQYELLFLLLLAAAIALAIKFVGVVLVTALLIIPAATAQNISRSLSQMFGFSVIISIISVSAGMLTSAALSTPSGPTIILSSTVLFVLSIFVKLAHAPR
ncbi:MAG: metal ABC transporter permease [Candidatus Andersenbacteria bacterium]